MGERTYHIFVVVVEGGGKRGYIVAVAKLGKGNVNHEAQKRKKK